MYGQLAAQYRTPMHRLYACSFRPSSLCTVADTGQTGSHGASSHCWHNIGTWPTCGFSVGADVVHVAPDPVHGPAARRPASGPTTGMLFSDWQAISHPPHPTQADRSMVMPHL